MANYKAEITAILEAGGKCTRKEYERIRKEVKAKAPCKILAFGLGHESEWLVKLNKGGRTVFIENNPAWVEKYPNLEVIKVTYNSRHLNDGKLHPFDLLMMDLPEIEGELFDLVWIDSPIGKTQGRMKSIVTGFAMCKEGGMVLVHDINRPTEKLYTDSLSKHPYEVVDALAVVKR